MHAQTLSRFHHINNVKSVQSVLIMTVRFTRDDLYYVNYANVAASRSTQTSVNAIDGATNDASDCCPFVLSLYKYVYRRIGPMLWVGSRHSISKISIKNKSKMCTQEKKIFEAFSNGTDELDRICFGTSGGRCS